jgi:CheY-like chemotaxis protein
MNRILYVEDDEGVGPLMESVLTSGGYTVEVATSVPEAWRAVDRRAQAFAGRLQLWCAGSQR